MLEFSELNLLQVFARDNHCKNESTAIGKLLITYNRLQTVIAALEKKAHEAEGWKQKAKNPGGIPLKSTIVTDASKDTNSKQKLVENTNDIQQQSEAA